MPQDILTELTRLPKHFNDTILAAYRRSPKRRRHSRLQPLQRANLGEHLPVYLDTPDYACCVSNSTTHDVLHHNLLHRQQQRGTTLALTSDIYGANCKIITSYAIRITSPTLIELTHYVKHIHNLNSVKIN